MQINLSLPTSWNDLSLAQQLQAYAIIMSGDALAIYEPHEVVPIKRILLFQTLTGITDQQLQAWQADCLASDPEHGDLEFYTQIADALASCNFLFDIATDEDDPTAATTYTIALTLTHCPWPSLTRSKGNGKKKTYYAPAADLANVSFLELCVTFALFEQYIRDYDEAILHELLAVLFRPPKPVTRENRQSGYRGDRRQPYLHHEAMVPKRARYMATLPMATKQLLVFWFASCRQSIIQQYPDLFTGGETNPTKYGWGAVLMAMAGGLQYLDTVSEQPATDALTYLDYLNEQAREQERRLAHK